MWLENRNRWYISSKFAWLEVLWIFFSWIINLTRYRTGYGMKELPSKVCILPYGILSSNSIRTLFSAAVHICRYRTSKIQLWLSRYQGRNGTLRDQSFTVQSIEEVRNRWEKSETNFILFTYTHTWKPKSISFQNMTGLRMHIKTREQYLRYLRW